MVGRIAENKGQYLSSIIHYTKVNGSRLPNRIFNVSSPAVRQMIVKLESFELSALVDWRLLSEDCFISQF